MKKIVCPKCKIALEIVKDGYFKNIWIYNRNNKIFDFQKEETESFPYCANCKTTLSVDFLSTIALKHIVSKRNKALGTNFYKSYSQNPYIYHQFSLAEDKENKILKQIIKFCSPDKTRLLDVGSGTGKYINLLNPYCKLLFALEPSKIFLNFSIKKSKIYKKRDNIIHLLGGGERIPLPDNYIDITIATWSTFSINDTFKEMIRVLKKGGKIIRVGAVKRDEFTSLFPKLDCKLLLNNNRWFVRHGFITRYLEIDITFSTIKEAQKVLSKIVGVQSIHKKSFKHTIALQIFSK